MKKTKAGAESSVNNRKPSCWCGSAELEYFSGAYLKCSSCQTLVSTLLGKYGRAELDKKQAQFYGKSYWVDYQQQELGFPAIDERARQDLSGRCLYWLKTILQYKLPVARALELGSSHGGFVALLGWAGYTATGVEINQWIIDFACRAFSVNLLLGDLAAQNIQKSSLDIIALMDVLEHVTDPGGVVTHCAELLAPDGIMVIQTPCYPENTDYRALQSANSPFLSHLHEQEHLYLFSRQSIAELLSRVSVRYVAFEPALFAHYDMYLVAGKKPLKKNSAKRIEQALSKQPEARMVLALCDLDDSLKDANKKLAQAETERSVHLSRLEESEARLAASDTESSKRYAQINELTALLRESESDRDNRMKHILVLQETLASAEGESKSRYLQIKELTQLLKKTEAESDRRYEQINGLTGQLTSSEKDRAATQEQIEQLNALLKECEADRAARLQQIEQLTAWLQKSEADRAARLQQIETLGRRLNEVDRENKERFAQIEKLQAWLKQSEADKVKLNRMLQELTDKRQ